MVFIADTAKLKEKRASLAGIQNEVESAPGMALKAHENARSNAQRTCSHTQNSRSLLEFVVSTTLVAAHRLANLSAYP